MNYFDNLHSILFEQFTEAECGYFLTLRLWPSQQVLAAFLQSIQKNPKIRSWLEHDRKICFDNFAVEVTEKLEERRGELAQMQFQEYKR